MDDVAAVQAHMEDLSTRVGMKEILFKAVSSEYYDQSYDWRAEQLGADSIYCLSKSIIMENTKLPEDADPKRLRYVCVVVQYAGVKLHKEKLGMAAKAIEVSRGLEPMGRKSYNYRLVSQEVNDQLSGYLHNAVCPLGMSEKLPVVISDKLPALECGYFWLGGGHVDLKMRVNSKEFLESFKAVVAPITNPDEGEKAEEPKEA